MDIIDVVSSIWFWLGIASGLLMIRVVSVISSWDPARVRTPEGKYLSPCGRKTKYWMRLLCMVGVHWHGRSDGGGMGDAYSCHVCGRDNYWPCFIVHDESGGREFGMRFITISGLILLGIAIVAVIIFALGAL